MKERTTLLLTRSSVDFPGTDYLYKTVKGWLPVHLGKACNVKTRPVIKEREKR